MIWKLWLFRHNNSPSRIKKYIVIIFTEWDRIKVLLNPAIYFRNFFFDLELETVNKKLTSIDALNTQCVYKYYATKQRNTYFVKGLWIFFFFFNKTCGGSFRRNKHIFKLRMKYPHFLIPADFVREAAKRRIFCVS